MLFGGGNARRTRPFLLDTKIHMGSVTLSLSLSRERRRRKRRRTFRNVLHTVVVVVVVVVVPIRVAVCYSSSVLTIDSSNNAVAEESEKGCIEQRAAADVYIVV